MNRLSLWAVALAAAPTVVCAAEISDGDTIIVSSTRYEEPLSSALSPVVVITGDDIRKMQATSFADIARTLPDLQLYVNGGRGQQSKIMVRGGNATDTLVLVNGLKLNSAYDGAAYIERIPVHMIERIEYIRGVRASIYGSQASAAVINIITRPGFNEDNIHARVSYGSYKNRQGSLSFKHSVGENGELKLAVGAEKEKGYNVHPIEDLNGSDHHGFQGTNFMADYQHRLGDFTLFADFSYNQTKSQFDSSYDNDWGTAHEYDANRYDNYSFELGGKYDSEIYKTRLTLNYQKTDDYEQIMLNPFREKKSDNTPIYTRTTAVNWSNELAAGEYVTIGGGVDYRRDRLVPGSKSYYTPIEAEHPLIQNTGTYLLVQLDAAGVQAEASGRYDHNTQYGGHFTYQGGLGYTFLDDFKVGLRYGTSFRAPGYMELYYPYAGNGSLNPEKSNSLEAMLRGDHGSWNWRVSLFRNNYKDRIVYYYETYSYKNIARADVRGIEGELGFEVFGIKNRLSGSIKSSRDRTNHRDVPYIPKRDFKWTLLGSVYDFDLSASFQAVSSRYVSDGGRRLGGYGTVNLGVGYNISDNFKVTAKADNIFDRRYEYARGYRTPEATYAVGFEFNY
ncbi:MAG: TonB-dependent receptor [Succinivibrionaceae bacterium]|nr:TonB-dependent receptor [Succinivibrionaceae bacterium]